MAARVGVAPAGDGLRYSGSLQPPAQPSDADLDRGLVSLNRSCRRSAAPSCPGTPAGAPWSPAGPARAPLRPFTPNRGRPGCSSILTHPSFIQRSCCSVPRVDESACWETLWSLKALPLFSGRRTSTRRAVAV